MSFSSRLPLFLGTGSLALILLQILWTEFSMPPGFVNKKDNHKLTVGSKDLPNLDFREEETEEETTEPSTTEPVELTSPKAKKLLPKVNPKSKAKTKEIKQKPAMPDKSILNPKKVIGSTVGGLPALNPRNVTHVLVTSYFRAGSEILGEILQQNRKTFYHFEPVQQLNESGLRIKDEQMPHSFSLMKDLMYCNFTSPLATNFLLWAKKKDSNFSIWRNRFLRDSCSKQGDLCFRSDFVRFVCLRSPWQVMRVNMLSLQQVGQFVLDNPQLDIRVLHLVRDPRGIISSRKELPWCNTSRCSDFRVLCSELNSDYKVFKKLQKLRPDRFFQLRLEDLAMNPQRVCEQMLGSLGVPYTKTVQKFLQLITKAKDYKNPDSSPRNLSTTVVEWINKMKMSDIKEIQVGCTSTLKNYNYVLVNSS